MKPARALALVGLITGFIAFWPFFLMTMFDELFEDAGTPIPFLLWIFGYLIGFAATIALFSRKSWAAPTLAGAGGVMTLVAMALALWAGEPGAAFFGLPGWFYAIAGIIPQQDGPVEPVAQDA